MNIGKILSFALGLSSGNGDKKSKEVSKGEFKKFVKKVRSKLEKEEGD